MGLDALRHLLVDTNPIQYAKSSEPPAQLDAPGLSGLVDEIAADGHGLIMVMGKGGVGKTTLAAAIAVELADRGLPVHLTTCLTPPRTLPKPWRARYPILCSAALTPRKPRLATASM